MLLAFCFLGTDVPSAACVPQKPGVRQMTGTVVEVVEVLVLVLVEVLVLELVLVDVELEVLVLLDVLVLVLLDVLVLVLVELLVLVDVEVDVLVVPQLFVHESPSLALPSSHASPEVTCTTPSPQIVHGLASSLSRHSCPLAGQPVCEPAGSPHGFSLPSARIAGQHCPSPGMPGSGFVSQVSKSWLTMPSPHTAGKNSTALPPASPVVHGVPGGV